nr:MAG TPA: hypothetical protein [Caudoviricetes sp.]
MADNSIIYKYKSHPPKSGGLFYCAYNGNY